MDLCIDIRVINTLSVFGTDKILIWFRVGLNLYRWVLISVTIQFMAGWLTLDGLPSLYSNQQHKAFVVSGGVIDFILSEYFFLLLF